MNPREWGFATYLWHNQIRINAWHAGFVAVAVAAATAFDRIFYCGFSVFRAHNLKIAYTARISHATNTSTYLYSRICKFSIWGFSVDMCVCEGDGKFEYAAVAMTKISMLLVSLFYQIHCSRNIWNYSEIICKLMNLFTMVINFECINTLEEI